MCGTSSIAKPGLPSIVAQSKHRSSHPACSPPNSNLLRHPSHSGSRLPATVPSPDLAIHRAVSLRIRSALSLAFNPARTPSAATLAVETGLPLVTEERGGRRRGKLVTEEGEEEGGGRGAQCSSVTQVSCPNKTASDEHAKTPSPLTGKSCALTRSSPSLRPTSASVRSSSSSASRPVAFGALVEGEVEKIGFRGGDASERQRRMWLS